MNINFFLPSRYNKETKQYEAEMYTNVTSNVYRGTDIDATLEESLVDIESDVDKASEKAEEALTAAKEAKEAAANIVTNVLIIQSEVPEGTSEKLWINTDNDLMHYWNGSEWKPTGGIWG